MSSILGGITTIIFCSTGYYYSWRYVKKENYKIAVLLLLLCGFVLRLYTSSDFFLHDWDERYHALVAKNLIQHPLVPTLYDNPILPYDYKIWVGNHIWLHKQPLPLWTMATSMWLFGTNEIALRLPSILLTTIGIPLLFFIGTYFFNKKTGYLSAFFYSINGLIIELASGRITTDHIDAFFLFFIELAIVFSIVYVKKGRTIYTILTGISMGAAILTKWLPALIVIPIWLLLVFDKGDFKLRTIIIQLFLLTITCILIVLPWQLYTAINFPLEAEWEKNFNAKHFTEVVESQKGSIFYYFEIIRINCCDLIYIPLIWFFWKLIRNIEDKKRWAIAIWFLIPFLFFSVAKTKMPAYILFTYPALFMIMSEFWLMLSDQKNTYKLKWLINLFLILMIILPIRYTLERVKPFENLNRNPPWVINLKDLGDKKIKNGVLFNYKRPIEAMFYTDMIAYSHILRKEELIDLIAKGYTIVINDDGTIPNEIKELKGVSIVRL